jgi:hypothetical protein
MFLFLGFFDVCLLHGGVRTAHSMESMEGLETLTPWSPWRDSERVDWAP